MSSSVKVCARVALFDQLWQRREVPRRIRPTCCARIRHHTGPSTRNNRSSPQPEGRPAARRRCERRRPARHRLGRRSGRRSHDREKCRPLYHRRFLHRAPSGHLEVVPCLRQSHRRLPLEALVARAANEAEPCESRWALANHPVINVFWFDALAFCRWPGACPGLDAGQVVRLPAEWEWLWVSQVGRAAHAYPWGNEWRPLRANSRDSGTGTGRWPSFCAATRRTVFSVAA